MGRILFVDVQAVGTPGKGCPLEIAWKIPGSAVQRFFFRNHNPDIPPLVQRLTGIENTDLSGENALPAEDIAALFLEAAGIPDSPLELVAHHAVYEKRWMDHITGNDLDFLCTREMALKRIKGIKSSSLRAVAGIVGHIMGSCRRASAHVQATEAVYKALVEGFTHEPVSREMRLALPEVPGVYRFLDPGDNVLYTGKAKNLRNRVNSHFTGRASGRRGEMLSRVSSIEFDETETAFHAAVKESEQISNLAPEYNRAGKILDFRLWHLSRDMTGILEGKGEKGCFGPFVSKVPLESFTLLVSAIASEKNKAIDVENLFAEVPWELFNNVFDRWRAAVIHRGILNCGRDLHLQATSEVEDDVEAHEEVIDEAFLENKLNAILQYGTLLCRRTAAVKLLAGCRIIWKNEDGSGTVNNFVENSATEELDQPRVRKLMVVLSELRRIYRAGTDPELVTSFGCVLKGEKLRVLMDSV